MIDFTKAEIARYYETRAPKLRQTQTREWRGQCIVHNGKGPNFSVKSDTGQAHCHSQCSRGWDIISLEMELFGCDFVKAKAEVFRIIGRPAPSREDADVEARYDYVDADGKLLYQVIRKHGKKFLQRRPDGVGGWIWNLRGMTPVP